MLWRRMWRAPKILRGLIPQSARPPPLPGSLTPSTSLMPSPSRAAAEGAESKLAAPGSKSSPLGRLSDESTDTQTRETQSVGAQGTVVMKPGVSTTVIEVKTTIKTAIKSKEKEKKRKGGEDEPFPQKRTRNTAGKSASNMHSYPSRAKGMKMIVGAHVSMAKGPIETPAYESHKNVC